jgi:Spy/CpxP family protein refolding chaperone
MKEMMKRFALFSMLALPLLALGQMPAPPHPLPSQDGPRIAPRKRVMVWKEKGMGKWWQDSQIAKQLQLSDSQISQLNQIFYDHRLKLIDDGAEMEKADLKLQNLLDQDEPKDAQVEAQVDQVLAARGKLEREYTMMNLDLRKVLSVQQWKQLKSIRNERRPGDHVFFFKRFSTGSGPGSGPMPPLPPPPPGPGEDEMF